MRAIWKFPLFTGRDYQVDVEMSVGAQILRFDVQYVGPLGDKPRQGHPTVWALVDTTAAMAPRRFAVLGTGHEVPDDHRYIGSYDADPFVWHVFEIIAPGADRPWTDWNGGDDWPTGEVDVQFANGTGHEGVPAAALDWGETDEGRIVRYRTAASE